MSVKHHQTSDKSVKAGHWLLKIFPPEKLHKNNEDHHNIRPGSTKKLKYQDNHGLTSHFK